MRLEGGHPISFYYLHSFLVSARLLAWFKFFGRCGVLLAILTLYIQEWRGGPTHWAGWPFQLPGFIAKDYSSSSRMRPSAEQRKLEARVHEILARYWCARADLSFYTHHTYLNQFRIAGKGPAYVTPAT